MIVCLCFQNISPQVYTILLIKYAIKKVVILNKITISLKLCKGIGVGYSYRRSNLVLRILEVIGCEKLESEIALKKEGFGADCTILKG